MSNKYAGWTAKELVEEWEWIATDETVSEHEELIKRAKKDEIEAVMRSRGVKW